MQSLKSLSQVSTDHALLTRGLRFRFVTFGAIGSRQVDSEKLTSYCEYVLQKNLAHNIKRITVGAPEITSEGTPIDKPLFCCSLDAHHSHLLTSLVLRAIRLREFSFHCDGQSIMSFMANQSVVNFLTACPLVKLSLTGVTPSVVNAIGNIRSLRILRLIMEERSSETVPTDLSSILRNSSSTLVQLTISTPETSLVSDPLKITIIVPRVRSLAWHVYTLGGSSPADLHRAFPSIRSISTTSRILARSPRRTDFTSPTLLPISLAGDRNLIMAYARFGEVLHAMPNTPLGKVESIRSLWTHASSLFPSCRLSTTMLMQLEFIHIYHWSINHFPEEGLDSPPLLNRHFFPRLSYLCFCGRWEDDIPNSRRVGWSNRTIEFIERATLVHELPRGSYDQPSTFEFRVINERNGTMSRSWLEAALGGPVPGLTELSENEGLVRRQNHVGAAHFLA